MGPNLIVNGGFKSGPLGQNAPANWTYLNQFGAFAAGVVSNNPRPGPHSGTNYYRDGAVQAYDAITQQIPTTIGNTYNVSFWLSDNSGLTTFSNVATNGGTSTDGNGINVVVYAGDSVPTPVGSPAQSSVLVFPA